LMEKIGIVFASAHARAACKYSALLAVFCWLGAGLFLADIALSAAAAGIFFFTAFFAGLYWPELKRRQHCESVEAAMPFALMNIAVELNLGVSFFAAIEHAAGINSPAGREFGIVAGEVRRHGASVQDALRHLSERVGNRNVKRSVVQLVAAFEQGGCGGGANAGEPIKRIAGEILARQRIESKLFSGKLVVFSLLFIAVSAVIPALFQSFSIIGSAVLRWNFTPMQSILIIAVGFPLLDIAILLYIRAKTPVFLRGN